MKTCLKFNWPFCLMLFACLAMTPAIVAQEETADGFALPQPGHHFSFPRDYGSHDDFKIEWWYITGHLFAGDDRRFGFQATFFRTAAPLTASPGGTTNLAFGRRQLYFAHMAMLDVKSGQYVHQQRLNRNGWDAWSATNSLDVRNGNWTLVMTDTNRQTMNLAGSVGGDDGYELTLTPRQPLVVFGTNSVSRKAADPTAASYYLTFPRLAATGSVRWHGVALPVHGEAWMDHEISSSQLGANQTGWDWCCLQFTNGQEIMAYRMRRADGTQDDYSTLAWISTNGVVQQLPSRDFTLHPLRLWHSPDTGASYPVNVRLQTHAPGSTNPLAFDLEPLADNQEINDGSVAYWEGACRIRDAQGRDVGSAFLELTGYARSLTKNLH